MCVYGVPSKSGAPGESDVVVSLSAAEGKSVDLKEMMECCKTRLPKSPRPGYLKKVEEIPKTISPKAVDTIVERRFPEDQGQDI